jgi:thiol-disulfide isomerase/thioredoxin
MERIVSQIKPLISVLLLFGLLQVTGWWDPLQVAVQSLVLKTGVMNANVDGKRPPAQWDFNFSVHDLSGNTIPFEHFKGAPVFLNIWATWCGPCKAEMPGINELYRKMKDNNISFVMLSVDRSNPSEKVKSYLAKGEYEFPVYLADPYLPEMMQVPSLPTTFIIDKEGKVIFKQSGARNYNTSRMVKFLNDLAEQ